MHPRLRRCIARLLREYAAMPVDSRVGARGMFSWRLGQIANYGDRRSIAMSGVAGPSDPAPSASCNTSLCAVAEAPRRRWHRAYHPSRLGGRCSSKSPAKARISISTVGLLSTSRCRRRCRNIIGCETEKRIIPFRLCLCDQLVQHLECLRRSRLSVPGHHESRGSWS